LSDFLLRIESLISDTFRNNVICRSRMPRAWCI